MLMLISLYHEIIAIRGERGNYNRNVDRVIVDFIIAIRGERGNYNYEGRGKYSELIIAIRGERGNYNLSPLVLSSVQPTSPT